MPLRRRKPKIFLLLASAFVLLSAHRAAATVTVTDCTSDPHCRAAGKKTVVAAPQDTLVVAGALAPLPGTETIQLRAQAIAVDGSSGGQITASGKGRSIVLDAASILVTGALHSTNSNGKIYIRGIDMVQVQAPANLDSAGGQTRIVCNGIGCTIAIMGVHLSANYLFIDALGDVIWDMNIVDLHNARDLGVITSEGGSIRKTGAITVALASGKLTAQVTHDKVDAVSEAVTFCETCQSTPTPTPAGKTATPTPPLSTASLPIGTPTPARTGLTPTPTRTPTPTGLTPTATPTPGTCCNTITGSSESNLTISALNDVDLSHDHYLIAENITVNAGGNIDLTNAELRNDFGKCGEIVVTAGGQVNIQGATIVDDDCKNNPDVSSINGREAVPHTGFNDVVGTPALDD